MRLCPILRAPAPSPDADLAVGGGLFDEQDDADEVVTISRAELEELRSMAGQGSNRRPPLELEAGEALKAREAAHAREIAERDRKAQALEQAYKAAIRDRELATALVGKSLVPGAASQLIKLWRDDFEVIDDGGEVQVVARDGRGVTQAVADRLGGPEFAHFCLPSSRGGTGAKGQGRSHPPAQAPVPPKTLGEAVVIQWREAAARSDNPPPSPGWGRRR